MRGWIVLAAVLLLLFLLGQLRLGAVGEYVPEAPEPGSGRGLSASASTQGGAQGLRKRRRRPSPGRSTLRGRHAAADFWS